MDVQILPAMLIDAPPEGRIRPVDKKKAKEIADSIREIGLLTPLIVKPGVRVRNGSQVPGWDILAGHHRFEALFRILNWTEIPCIVTDAQGLRAELFTIDENLVRRELSDAERAFQTARRKEIYEAIHPELAHGAAPGKTGGGKAKRESRQIGDLERFSTNTAKSTGRSERTVQREAERGEKLGPVLNRIIGTSLDRGVEIDALAGLPHHEREELVSRAEKGERVSARKPEPVAENVVSLDHEEMQANTIARRLMREYLHAPFLAREAFDALYREDLRNRVTVG